MSENSEVVRKMSAGNFAGNGFFEHLVETNVRNETAPIKTKRKAIVEEITDNSAKAKKGFALVGKGNGEEHIFHVASGSPTVSHDEATDSGMRLHVEVWWCLDGAVEFAPIEKQTEFSRKRQEEILGVEHCSTTRYNAIS